MNEDMKKDIFAFLKKDTFQAFVVVAILFTTLLIIRLIDMSLYGKLMMVGMGGLYGSELTNINMR